MIYSDALIFSPPRGLADRILCAVAKIANTVLGNPQSATKKANFECMTKRHESLIAGICEDSTTFKAKAPTRHGSIASLSTLA